MDLVLVMLASLLLVPPVPLITGPVRIALQDYPREPVLGEQVEVTLGTVNHEHQYMNYNVAVRLDGQNVCEIAPINLAYEGEWPGTVTLASR